MSPLILYNNKLLVKDNKLAGSLDCCCEECDGPVKLYQCGGLYYNVGLYESLELAAYDCNNKRVFSWKYCNDARRPDNPNAPDERGNVRYQNINNPGACPTCPGGVGCAFTLKGTFTDANSPAITIRWAGPYGLGDNPNPPFNGSFPGAGGGIVKTVSWADLNFNGVPYCNGPYCAIREIPPLPPNQNDPPCPYWWCDEDNYLPTQWPGNNPPTP